jgi:hypothetical protein
VGVGSFGVGVDDGIGVVEGVSDGKGVIEGKIEGMAVRVNTVVVGVAGHWQLARHPNNSHPT